MATAQIEFTESDLLAGHQIAEPLVMAGVRCHGGFDEEGRYVSPRTRWRLPAIAAWQDHHRAVYGTEILDVPLETWPAHYPNTAQARFLIGAGVPEPLMATLTRIGTVEGLGANIRHLNPGDLQRHFSEDIHGTATAHLGRGLFEAHGRDEAGWEEEAGHKDMWFAARDIAFEGRTANVDVEAMLQRMGFGSAAGGSAPATERILPADIDANLELVAALMARVLLIEIQAFHTFAWAEEWLADAALVAGNGTAATIVGYIRADETPHVEYLRTALSEMRDRTWVGASGRRYPGTEMIESIWTRALDQSLGAGRAVNRKAALGEVEYWCSKRPEGAALLAEFHSLADTERPTDGPGAPRADGALSG